MKKYDCTGIGRSCLDYLALVDKYPEKDTKIPISDYLVEGGGQVATALVTLARLGARVKFIGKVGADEIGKIMLQKLKKEKVDVSEVIIEKKKKSQIAMIWVEKTTGKRTIVYQKSELGVIKPHQIASNTVISSRYILIDPQETLSGLGIIKLARKNNTGIIYDAEKPVPGIEQMIKYCDYLICDSKFPELFLGKMNLKKSMSELKKMGPKIVVVTLGDKGAIAFSDNIFIENPAYSVKVVDTTGAGDSFHGAFIYGLLKNWKIEKIMEFSSAVAGLSCQGLGGRQSLPNLKQVNIFLKKTKYL